MPMRTPVIFPCSALDTQQGCPVELPHTIEKFVHLGEMRRMHGAFQG